MIPIGQSSIQPKMDAAELLEEFRLAQEEHARALAAVKEQSARVEAARVEVERARATEKRYERDLEIATAQLSEGLRALHLPEEDSITTSSPLQSVKRYLVEYHANIGCYHCYLHLDEDVVPSTVDTSVLSLSVDLTKVTFSSAAGVWWSVELEHKVDADKCVISAKDDHIYIRLPVSASDKAVVDGFSSFSQTTQEELRVESYSSLSCRGCGWVLMEDGTKIEKVLPLPSENWMEMFDFWGAGIGSFEHIPREGIFAQQHRIFVGESSIIVHESDLTERALADTFNEPLVSRREDNGCEGDHPDWNDVSCPQCKIILGQRRVENPATLRISKHLLVAGDLTNNVFDRYTIDSTISAQMLHLADSDGVFRFRLSSRGSEGYEKTDFSGLEVQLLSWDAKIVTTNTPTFQRVLKVVYSVVHREAALQLQKPQVELPPMLRTRTLSISEAVGEQITQRLKLSTDLLPSSQRNFNKMTVGYLYA